MDRLWKKLEVWYSLGIWISGTDLDFLIAQGKKYEAALKKEQEDFKRHLFE